MSGITTHVLDLALGSPARNVAVRLERAQGAATWTILAERRTDDDGRVKDLHPAAAEAGRYRITFATGEYFAARGAATFHPEVTVTFEIADSTQHYHVPLLLSPYGYSTYRGS